MDVGWWWCIVCDLIAYVILVYMLWSQDTVCEITVAFKNQVTYKIEI